MTALATTEKTRFVALERTIERGFSTFVEVGTALVEIQDKRLYRSDHRTFESYCRDRWGLARNRAYQLMEAADVSKNLDKPPRVESHAAALAPLKDKPEVMAEAWDEAVEKSNGKPTAEAVRGAVDRRLDTETLQTRPRTEPCPTCGRPMRVDKPARGKR